MSSDRSHKDPFECEDEEEVDVGEEASSVNSDEEEEHTAESIESSEMGPRDVVESLLSSLTTHLVFLLLSPFMIPFTFISTKICCAFSPIMC